jgi:aspartyl-tRNA(Asn)/glutamyl-tRNA(Gln) amidotransferase subunit B
VDDQTINMPAAKEVFQQVFDHGGDPAEIVKEKGLAQVSDAGEIETLVDEAIASNPKSVEAFQGGKGGALQHLVGQVMRASRGKANPQKVMAILRQRLGG